jgi:hypothetical protein
MADFLSVTIWLEQLWAGDAAQLGCSVSTVERKLQLIREAWEREAAP